MILLIEIENRDVESKTTLNIADLNDLIMTENMTVTSTNLIFFYVILIVMTSSLFLFDDLMS